jgi:hypothetical protein
MQARLDPASHARYPRRVPPAPSDRTLLLATGAAVVLAGVVFAVVLFFSTGGGQATPKPGPIYIGLASDLRNNVESQGPAYYPHPFGGVGYWVALENNQLVALVARRPGTQSCTVRWVSHLHSYVDCHGDALVSRELDRYELTLPLGGAEAGGVIVNFAKVVPAPEPLPTG